MTGWENLKLTKMRQFSKDICDTIFDGRILAPLEDTRRISEGDEEEVLQFTVYTPGLHCWSRL